MRRTAGLVRGTVGEPAAQVYIVARSAVLMAQQP